VRQLYQVLSAWRVYHFHDTSAGARVKQMGDIHQNEALLEDDGNLAAYLYLMREKHPCRLDDAALAGWRTTSQATCGTRASSAGTPRDEEGPRPVRRPN